MKKFFLILAILFFLLAVMGIMGGVVSVFIFCVLCGLVCLYVSRLFKKNNKKNEREDRVVASPAPAPVKQEAADQVEKVSAVADMVDIVFPDGHVEQRRTWMTIDDDEGCLVTEGGHTYHTDCGCFYNWSEEYRARFAGWQLISISEAKRRDLRKCKFCKENDSF